jgi:hypothetical protein
MSSTSRLASFSAAALWLAVSAAVQADPVRLTDSPGDPLHPDPGAARVVASPAKRDVQKPGAAPRQSRLGTGGILVVEPPIAPCDFAIVFGDVASAPPPGFSHDGVLESGFTDFAERFAGQSVSAAGDFDVLDGNPSNPLALVAGAPGRNLDVMSYLGRPVLSPLGPRGFPEFTAVGEGALAVLFDRDQAHLSFDVIGGDGGSAHLEFFRRDGSRIDAITLTGLSDRRYAFLRDLRLRDIAGFSMWNDDLAGVGIERLCHEVEGVPGHPPACGAGGPYAGFAGEPVAFDAGASSDPEGGPLSYEWHFGDGGTATGVRVTHVFSGAGRYAIRLCVTDRDGGRTCCDSRVDVAPARNAAPDCAAALATPRVLWPPDHRLVPVRISGVTDADSDPVSLSVTGVSSNEPDPGAGDGNASPDFSVDAAGRLWLRAERSGRGSGRTYIVSFTARDGRGGECQGRVEVCVPKSRRDDCAGSRLAADANTEQAEATLAPARLELRRGAPSGSALTVEYELPASGFASLAVYDLAGRVVSVLDRGVRSEGPGHAAWNTAGVAPGLYFCALRAGGETRVLRLVVR